MFDVIVIGKGLFGVSAVRHLSQSTEKVAIIGPDEPANPATHQGVYGAHYDEGRLTYQLKHDPVWAKLAVASLSRFPTIEQASGIRFHTPVGNLYVADKGMDNGRFNAFTELKPKDRAFAEQLDFDTVRRRFPFFEASNDSMGLWEDPPAGYLSPRRFLQAQLALADGVTIVPDIAVGLELEKDGVIVRTAANGRFEAKKVLIAAGAYSNGFGLLERPLALTLKCEYVIRARLPMSEVERLKDMPPIVYRIDHPRLSELYILPPIRYPDGAYYLKMGANTVLDAFIETVEEINDWYRAGDSDAMLEEMRELVLELFPGLTAESWRTHRCVITRTAHARPYIDQVIPGRVYVAVGGNGQGAKAADEVGRLAAELVVQGRNPGEAFTAVYR